MSWKQTALDLAEVIDAMRLFPRIMMAAYAIAVGYVTIWFVNIDAPSATQMGFAQLVWGAAGMVTGWYYNTGRRWDGSKHTYSRGHDYGFYSGEGVEKRGPRE